ncbi:MerR family transcriptional regulator [Nocardiopsis sp. CNT312]|uniref:MerR family transcriptional regulator n=1 Tax=Nocardiopsis sp. CNT312 TaxID=1137268 RepID=UPI000560448F|nr:MerR family transcriptional regulator [Nocardiopsis sp. CNT312]
MRIGEVAERTGLSLRTIRYYGEVGLVAPSARSQGGFRLYTASDVDRLQLIKRMKPLGFSLEETRDLLAAVDGLESAGTSKDERRALAERLDRFEADIAERCAALRRQLEMAEEFGERLRHKRTERDASA